MTAHEKYSRELSTIYDKKNTFDTDDTIYNSQFGFIKKVKLNTRIITYADDTTLLIATS